ncbi:MAG: FAD-dependent oxidoreductase [Acidobacteria bacterium]|nr:FAD-dependent oxidoreductase [Acidobacteriota bacterium]
MAILGGGIPGLAAAYFLQQHGYDPVVFESERRGAAPCLEHEGFQVEKFAQCVTPRDQHLLSLLGELNLNGTMRWEQAHFGCLRAGRQYNLSSGPGWVRSTALFAAGRLRTDWASWLLGRRDDADYLNHVPVEPFLRAQFGERIFEKLWRPLLQAHFGDLYSRIPAEWFRGRLREGWFGESAKRGHLRGGSRELLEGLVSAVTLRGGVIRNNAWVQWILNEPHGVCLNVEGRTERFDAAVSTLALQRLREIAAGPLQEQVPMPQLVYQGLVSAVVITRQQIQRKFWNALDDSSIPFQVMTESTNLTPREWTRGRSVIHLSRYCRPASDLFMREDEEISSYALGGLREMFPGFDPRVVEACHVVREEYSRPVWPLGGVPSVQPSQVGTTRVYLCTDVQAYPHDRTWDTAIGQAKATAGELARSLAAMPKMRELAAAV